MTTSAGFSDPGIAGSAPTNPQRCRRRGAIQALFSASLGFLLTHGATGASAQEEETPPPSLQELAAEADLVALVQVLDTDYEYARDFPIGGTAFLRILIPYKLDRPLPDIIQVYEEGLHDTECYFPNPPVTEEGRRYLLFVRQNPDVEDQYLGLDAGCSLTALVTEDNRYALRYPSEGVEIADNLTPLASPTNFADVHAVIDYEFLEVDERISLLEQGFLEEREDRTYKLTHGIPLGDVRRLLGADNLTTDRALLRPPPVTEPEP